ncbi:MAG: type 1 glutamine amidotransferase [Gaiellaceae bacterium]
MRVLCLTHEEAGPAGLFADTVRERGDDLLEWNVSRGPLPSPAKDFDAVVVLGGSMHVDQEERHPWLAEQEELVRSAMDSEQPLFGVCLGGQLVARVAGAHVGPASRPEIGWHEVELTPAASADPVIGVLPPRFEALEWHSYAFELPEGAELLATSAVCPQAFRLGETTWGVQFHPEATLQMLEGWRAMSEGSAPLVGLEPIGRWNDLGRRLAGAFLDFARSR